MATIYNFHQDAPQLATPLAADDKVLLFDTSAGRTKWTTADDTSYLAAELASDQVSVLSAPQRFQRAGLFLSDEVGSDDTVDARAGLVRALGRLQTEDHWGGILRVDAPTFGNRTHLLSSRSAGGVTIANGQKVHIIGDDRALIDFTDWGHAGGATGKTVFTVGSTTALGTGIALTANITGGVSTSVTLASVAGLEAGQLVGLQDDSLFTLEDAADTAQTGERIYIDRIDTLTVYFKGRPRSNYTTANNAKLYPITGGKLRVHNLRMQGPGRFDTDHTGDTGFRCTYFDDVEFIGGELNGADQVGAIILGGYKAVMRDVKAVQSNVIDGGTNTQTAFCFQVTDTEYVHLENLHTVGSSQPINISASGTLGITRVVDIVDCKVRGAYGGAVALHNCQEMVTVLNLTAEDCEVGVDSRGGKVTVDGGRFIRMGAGSNTVAAGVLIRESAQDIIIRNLLVDGAKYGVKAAIADDSEGVPQNVQITDSRFWNIVSGFAGVLFYWGSDGSTATTGLDPMPGLKIIENDFVTLGTSSGIDTRGKLEYPEVCRNTFRGDGTGRSVFMQASDTTTAGEGPISPIVKGNTHSPTMLGPAIQEDTGNRMFSGNRRQGQPVFQTIATDADVTIDVYGNARDIRHTGTLGADRAVTLSTTDALIGDKFRITRTGGGAFNLNVGTGPLKALATNTWCEVTFNGSAWFLSAYGAL